MKHFALYTGLRIALFAAVFGVLIVIVKLAGGGGGDTWLFVLVGAAVLSSVISLKVLAGPRERLAQNVEARAARAASRFEEMRSREDAD